MGAISVLPIIVLFVMIFATKRMLLSLTCATLVGAILIGKANFAQSWLEHIQMAFTAGTVGYLFLLLALFGILIAILDVSKSVNMFAGWLSKFATTRKRTLLITYLLGWIIFVDDYLNNIAISTAMKKVADSHKIPRTFLGFVVNSTAAPVCILIPLSTWAVFYGGLYEEWDITVNGTGLGAYISGIPYLFFGWILLIIVFLVIIGVVPMMGVTRTHNRIALEQGIVCTKEVSADGEEIRSIEFENEGDVKNNPWFFLIPLIVLVAVTILASEVLVGCMAAIAVSGILMITVQKVKITEALDSAFAGIMSMVPVCCIITLTMTMVQINTSTGLADFVVESLEPYIHGAFLPAIVFGFCAVYSYFGGGFWDMSMVFMPIVVPLANAVNVDPILAVSALVCASAAGSTTYACGDAVTITSRAVDIKPYYQMLGTLPYVICAYVLTIIAYLIAGFTV